MTVAAPMISPVWIISSASSTGTQRTASASSTSGSPTRSARACHVDVLRRVR